jgi:hypothetical protein
MTRSVQLNLATLSRRLSFGLLVLGLSLHALVASAQDTGSAAALFDRGVVEMQAGQPETGCPALDESYRLDPKPGALFTAAECQVVWGRLYAAAQRYEAYVAHVSKLSPEGRARHEARVAQARTALQALELRIPRLLVVVASPAPVGLRFTLDGSPLAPESLQEPLRVDPGPHTLEASATRYKAWRLDVNLDESETRHVEVRLAPEASHQVRQELPPSVPDNVAPDNASPASASRWASLGWVLCGVGAAGVVVGSVAGSSVLHQKGIVEDECSAATSAQGKTCSERGMRAVGRGHDLAAVANVGFGVGIAGLAAGVLLLITSPTQKEAQHATQVAPLLLDVGSSGAWLGVNQRW